MKSFTLLLIFVFFSSAFAHAKIINGTRVDWRDPISSSTVGILYNGLPGCGGVLLAKHIVITAAHCIYAKHLGRFDIDTVRIGFATNLNDSSIVQSRKVTDYWAPEYPRHKTHDLVVLFFEGDAPFGFRPATLLDPTTDFEIVKGELVQVAGYGIQNRGVLFKTQLRVKDLVENGTGILADQSSGTGVCGGDSGGPFYLQDKSNVVLLGITSRGGENCESWAIFTSLAYFDHFLHEARIQLYRRAGLSPQYDRFYYSKITKLDGISGVWP